eukprot:4346253-Alexandrium_andersonii.AAC.1
MSCAPRDAAQAPSDATSDHTRATRGWSRTAPRPGRVGSTIAGVLAAGAPRRRAGGREGRAAPADRRNCAEAVQQVASGGLARALQGRQRAQPQL